MKKRDNYISFIKESLHRFENLSIDDIDTIPTSFLEEVSKSLALLLLSCHSNDKS